jgi:hypothetical protein
MPVVHAFKDDSPFWPRQRFPPSLRSRYIPDRKSVKAGFDVEAVIGSLHVFLERTHVYG